MTTETLTVKARVYKARGEKSNASLRAYIVDGECKGLRVSCSRAIRDAWKAGDTIQAIGRPVYAGGQSAYFKARTVEQARS